MMPAAITAAAALPAFSTSSKAARITRAVSGFGTSLTVISVATEITVRLVPKPETARVILAAFDDVEKAGNAAAAVIAAGIIPAGLEMMDQPATRAVEEYVRA